MKSFYISLLILFIFSCSAKQTSLSDSQTDTSFAIKNIDCSLEAKQYATNNYGFRNNKQYVIKNVSKQKDGSYLVSMSELSGDLSGYTIFTAHIWVNENCKVVKAKVSR